MAEQVLNGFVDVKKESLRRTTLATYPEIALKMKQIPAKYPTFLVSSSFARVLRWVF
jgi:hypothetical protein